MAILAVTVESQAVERKPRVRVVDRMAATFILLLLGVGSVVLWLGIPVGVLWLLSRITDSWNAHFLMGVALVPVAMALFAGILFWLNALYLRVTGVLRPGDEDEDDGRRLRGPLEHFLYAGLIVALVAFCVWFFFYASNPFGTFW